MEKNKVVIILNVLFLYIIIQSSYAQGARYTGEYKKATALEYVKKNNIVIEGLEFTNSNPAVFGGRCISLWKCENVIIRNCKFVNVAWATAILVENGLNVTITDCVFENVYKALTVEKSRGEVKFENNEVKNLVKGLHNGNGGGGVQIAESNGPGYTVNYNVFENLPKDTHTIDVIGVYRSNGTPESPITIKGNWIRGGGPLLNSGGIILGDIGGSYQIAEDNILVDPGQYGIQIAGGHDMTLRNNKVYAKKQPFTNVGLAVVNWTYEQQGPSYNIVVENNAINWISYTGAVGTAWFSEDMKAVVPNWRQARIRDASILSTILPEVILGRARGEGKVDGDNNNQDNDKVIPPGDEIVLSSDISIYKDKFDRICMNCKGDISFTATISISQENGQKTLSIPVMGYHTVIKDKLPPGTYNVTVQNGDKLQLKKITLK